ncbi:hypothetical protein [Pandoraea sp.]|uniref:hypothetical protein n=1 Tax=Pandoraea sp. TaxID=1883445 RepID=UPI0011FA952D|nr:hypothetical protein [Pandoraea sp.]TAL52885.1 MAG: hypothetical protein EPN80_17735 [Pandoraea sp.]TAM19670.1 MAG: hypothetical protein EPN65_02750 [Pandoraea sp.]
MNNRNRFFPVDAIAWGVLLFALSAQAQEQAPPSLDDQITQLSREINQQQREILSLKKRLTQLEMSRRGRGVTAWDAAQINTPSSAAATGDTGGASDAASAQDGGTAAIGQTQQQQKNTAAAYRSPSENAVVQEQHAPLFDKKLTIDAGVSYGYYDRRQLALTGFLALDAIFLGNINLSETKASVWTFDVNTRYGINDRLSVSLDVPYLYRSSDFISAGAGGAATALSDQSKNAGSIGDVTASVYYQFVKESATWPDIVGSLRVTAPTGTSPFGIKFTSPADNNNLNFPTSLPTGNGVWALTAGISVLRTYDPVILFGSLAYTYNLPRSFSDISPIPSVVTPAKVKLGDVLQVGAGIALALNDRTALSLSYSAAISQATKTQAPGEGYVTVPGSSSNAASLNVGLNYVINKHWTFNGYFDAGMSPDAPNYVIGIRFPYTF